MSHDLRFTSFSREVQDFDLKHKTQTVPGDLIFHAPIAVSESVGFGGGDWWQNSEES